MDTSPHPNRWHNPRRSGWQNDSEDDEDESRGGGLGFFAMFQIVAGGKPDPDLAKRRPDAQGRLVDFEPVFDDALQALRCEADAWRAKQGTTAAGSPSTARWARPSPA